MLGPLVSAAGRTPLRLMIGTRRHQLPGLGDAHHHGQLAELIDLDHPDYADPASIRRYLESGLLTSPTAPNRHQPRPYLDAVCDGIAAALVAARTPGVTAC